MYTIEFPLNGPESRVIWNTPPPIQSSLSLHCQICYFISWSEVKFPYGIMVVEVWNSSYVVLM